MTPADFDRLAEATQLGQTMRAIARRILVDGLSAAEAGREFGKSRAEASRAEWRIKAEALREQACPECGRPL